jgi:hypothetical protein
MHSNILEWEIIHSKKNGVNSCPLQKKLKWAVVHSKNLKFLEWNFVHSNFFGVDFKCTPNFLEWIEVHSKNFGVDLRCTPKLLEWNLGALQIFGVNFECMIVYSKVVRSTQNIPEWTASHSKKNGVHFFGVTL